MKKYTSILFLFALAIGCKKKEQSKESTWTANGETFTAVAITTIGKARTGLSSNDNTNRFGLIFYLPGYLPTDGNWPLGDTALQAIQNPDYAYLGFYYHGHNYQPSRFDTSPLQADIYKDGKVVYNLAPTWFINYDNSSDSVQISGNFYEP